MDPGRVEVLITAVEKRRGLYDKNSPDYSNRGYLHTTWRKIAHEVGCSENEARKRWKKLRDYFQKNNRELYSCAPGSAAIKKKKWYLYDRLLFLLPYLRERSSTECVSTLTFDEDVTDYKGNLSQTLSTTQCGDTPLSSPTPEDEGDNDQDNRANPSSTSTSQPHPQAKPSRRMPKPCPQQRTQEPEVETEAFGRGQQIMRERRDSVPKTDEDEYFFKSLIPKMRLLSTIEKMECQAEIHSVVLKYVKLASANADL